MGHRINIDSSNGIQLVLEFLGVVISDGLPRTVIGGACPPEFSITGLFV